jgi:farnesyl-diphosphate farnesyltransferase
MVTEEIEQYQVNRPDTHRDTTGQSQGLSTYDFQAYLLQGVSRTFALTIPQLPEALAWVVTNAYLLCRIVDTIEDEPALSAARKHYFCQLFTEVVAGATRPERFAAELASQLSDHTIPAEHELIQQTPYVIGITHRLNSRQQAALQGCVQLMAEGMVEFQSNSSPIGLRDLVQLDRYCYYVAGVVGEMLTRLFCEYSPDIAKHREALMKLAVSFGQGLQMTNILKDIWDDKRRGACWLPQDVFAAAGFDLRELAPGCYRDSFDRGLVRLIGIAHEHLKDALAYTLLIPQQETGIRNFCLLAVGLAVLTLRKINRYRDFSVSSKVKISRRSVKATLLTSRLTVAHDYMLKSLFQLAALGLPEESKHRGERRLEI